MDFAGWLAAVGALLLLMALSSALIRALPLTTAIVYLGIGAAVGPLGGDWLRISFDASADWLLRLTEVAVIASLFVGGLKLRVPLTDAAWSAPLRLAGPGMLISIVGLAAALHAGLAWPLPVALLGAAILAPTDPVLAGEVSVSDAADRDRLRYGLSGEAGLNDGSAFPFVVFGLSWIEHGSLGAWVGAWALARLVWAVPAGLAIGYALGRVLGRLGIVLRQRTQDLHAPSDFLGLALIALSYTAAEAAHAWGFLAVFAAGVGLRHAERVSTAAGAVPKQPGESSTTPDGHPPAEAVIPERPSRQDLADPTVAAGVLVSETLVFGDTLERLLEVGLVGLVGVLLAEHASMAGLLVAVVLFAVVRPAAVAVALVGSPLSRPQRRLLGWLGIRGIGSLYYLAYARTHGISSADIAPLASVVVTVVAASIVVHGVSGQPLLQRYERRLTRPSSSRT